MAFGVKKGDIVYASDGTLGFVADVFRLQRAADPDAGWAAVDVAELNAAIYFTAADVSARDEAGPSVLLRLTYAEATDEAHRHVPDSVASGEAQAEAISPLEVGRPESSREGDATAAQIGQAR
jgi:hypothetical protein